MKKSKIALFMFFALIVSSCNGGGKAPAWQPYDDTQYKANVDKDGYTIIDVYGLNDFHGALVRDEDAKHPGVGELNTYLKERRSENPGGTLFISSGDMWQGSADSNLTRGHLVTELMNYMGYEAMTLGNHEFDWSIAQIEENKKLANFPFLGSNIVDKTTKERAPFVDDSLIISRDGVNIGIVGVMGSELEYSVQTSLLANYEFDTITDYVINEAAGLRSKGADIVILAAHDSWVTSNLNPERQALLDPAIINAVYSGHQHVSDEHLENNVPILQTRGYGRDVMHVTFKYHKETKDVKIATYEVVKDMFNFTLKEDAKTKEIYNYYYKKYNIGKIKGEVLTKLVNKKMNQQSIAKFTVQVMQGAFEDVVGAVHNVTGGIRVDAFEIGKITYGLIYQAFPFDNEIYLVNVPGRRLKALMDGGGNLAYHFSVKASEVKDDQTYKVATISYVYESSTSPFVGLTFENKFVYPRDLIATYLRGIKTLDGSKY